ncbi:MAG: hypothetical protein IPF78_14820 [Flavobacteriales bacterium]|nr:hypothetical protein [Flavobacteriales bacterium]
MGRDEALAAAGQVEVGPYARPLSQVMERQHEALSRSDARRSWLSFSPTCSA